MRTASAASMRRPVSERSSAARLPTTRWSGASAMYGKRPTSISGVPKRASSAATAKSQAATSPRPPASAEPFTHATTGLPSRARSASRAAYPRRASWAASAPAPPTTVPRSAPAQKACAPAPVRQTTRAAGSESARASAWRSPAIISGVRAFRCAGRCSVSQRAAPRCSSRKSATPECIPQGPRREKRSAAGYGRRLCRAPAGSSRCAASGEHRPDDRDEPVDVALSQVVLAAGLDERPEHRVEAVLALLVEQRRERDLERSGDLGQGFQMRRPLAALDHGEERDADARALAQLLLRELRTNAREPQLADLAADFLDHARLTHRVPQALPPQLPHAGARYVRKPSPLCQTR